MGVKITLKSKNAPIYLVAVKKYKKSFRIEFENGKDFWCFEKVYISYFFFNFFFLVFSLANSSAISDRQSCGWSAEKSMVAE